MYEPYKLNDLYLVGLKTEHGHTACPHEGEYWTLAECQQRCDELNENQ